MDMDADKYQFQARQLRQCGTEYGPEWRDDSVAGSDCRMDSSVQSRHIQSC